MSKRNSLYKGTPRDSSCKHEVRELAHMHNMEQRGIKYPKAISHHDLNAQLIKISEHYNRQILAEQQIAAYHGREPDMKKITEIRKAAEYSAKLCTLRFLKRESSYVVPEKTEKRENLRRLQREFGRYYIDYVESTCPAAAAALREAGLVEEGTGIVVPWKTHVRENIDMIRVVG